MNVIDWLLDADPSIRWQVMRDLTHEAADVVAAERSRVATEGWGATRDEPRGLPIRFLRPFRVGPAGH